MSAWYWPETIRIHSAASFMPCMNTGAPVRRLLALRLGDFWPSSSRWL
jgi:hypothetical protein